VVAEYGRQPWVVDGLLPTFMGASSLSIKSIWISLGGFIFFYTVLAIVEVYLMIKYIRLGPDNLFAPSDLSVRPTKQLPKEESYA
jgi:cytochrome d ubiquinol oxidase subunit I